MSDPTSVRSSPAASEAASSASASGGTVAGVSAGASQAPKWLGKRVGRFKLVSLLGVGSWGRVFEAEDTLLRRRVALKLMSTRGKDGNVLDTSRLVHEARAAAALEHPHVVQIYEVGEIGDMFFIAMELGEGGSLEDVIRANGALDPIRACQLAAEAGEALAVAHSCGIIHRDVKPGNLLLSRSGRCKVTDFGLATIDDPNDPSHFARYAGTAYYVAPEVVRGNQADGRSDIYSLGATLFHMLSGQRPFAGDSRTKIMKAHVEQPTPDLRSLRPDLDPKLAETVAKAMDKDPSKRFQSAEQFARALRLFTVPVGAGMSFAGGPGASFAGNASFAGASFGAANIPITHMAQPQSRRWIGLAAGAAVMLIGLIALVLVMSGGDSSVERAQGTSADDSASVAAAQNPGAEPTPSATPESTPSAAENGSSSATLAQPYNPSQNAVPLVDPTPPANFSPQIPQADVTTSIANAANRVRHTFRLSTADWHDQPRSVHVAGDFNAWLPDSIPMSDPDGDRVWTTDVSVEPGLHHYKFVIDAGTDNVRWIPDPRADRSLEASDGHGGVNSGVHVTTSP